MRVVHVRVALSIVSLATWSFSSNAFTAGPNNELRPSCPKSAESCVFQFSVSHVYSMMRYDEQRRQARPVIIYPNRTAVYRDRPTCQTIVPMTEKQLEDVITADGTIKMMMVVNNQLPGPPIVVYEGQEVVVNVTNDLINEALTIHWHGLRQSRTPWMDGGGEVSQCAIQPQETFTYRFRADPVGTHWYHAHVGTQRTEGVYGPFIVLPGPSADHLGWPEHRREPHMEKEFSMMFQDWYHDSSFNIFVRYRSDLGFFGQPLGETSPERCFEGTQNVDTFNNAFFQFESGLINGKGRQYPLNSTIPNNPGIPLEVFSVQKGKKYLFRATSASMSHSFRVSIDGHRLYVVATDGCDVVPLIVDILIISPGERYDFYIDATDPDNAGNYWIRLETLENTIYYTAEPLTTPGHTEAVLRYDSGDTGDPMSAKRKCSVFHPCKVLNCPYRYYPVDRHITCIPLTELRQRIQENTLTPEDKPMVEHFLHFRYASTGGRATINGRSYLSPTAPPQTYPDQDYLKETCESPDCGPGQDYCSCTHVLQLPLCRIVQMVFFVYAASPAATTHPIHMHGHQYQVIKIGYPEYDRITGEFLSTNTDIKCLDTYCNEATWSNATWRGGNIPGITESGPVRKDTVSVPVGGYVVARFLSDNPGFWLMHCHMEFHNADGMTLIIKEGEEFEMSKLPTGFKTCGTFTWTEQEYKEHINKEGYLEEEGLTCADKTGAPVLLANLPSDINSQIIADSPDGSSSLTPGVALIVLAVISLSLFVICMVLLYKLKQQRNGRFRSDTSSHVYYKSIDE